MGREYKFFVYIMASRSLNFYIGLCNSIRRRVWEHKTGVDDGFTKRYNINRLVWFEQFQYFNNAVDHEKRLKKWSRAKKIALIKATNPTWIDLAEDWFPELNTSEKVKK